MDPPLKDKISLFKTIAALQQSSHRSKSTHGGIHVDDDDEDHDGDDLLDDAEQVHRQRCDAFRRAFAVAPATKSSGRNHTTIPATQRWQSSASATPLRPNRKSSPALNQRSSHGGGRVGGEDDDDVEIISVTPLPPRQQHRQQQIQRQKQTQSAKRRATADDASSPIGSMVPDSTRRPSPAAALPAGSTTATSLSSNKRRATHPLSRVQNTRTSPRNAANQPGAAVAAASPSVSVSKRKGNSRDGGQVLKMVPEDRQVFRGLSFYYVPNNDINAVRKARITKAREHGAIWTKELAAATHIIVDKALDHDNVVAEEGWAAGIVGGGGNSTATAAIIVNEDYPLHCISYRKLVNPQQPQYLVKGGPVPAPAPAPAAALFSASAVLVPATAEPDNTSAPASSGQSEVSLKLKPKHKNPARWDYVPPDGTPPRTDESSVQTSSAQPHATQVHWDSFGGQADESDLLQRKNSDVITSSIDEFRDITHVSETLLEPEAAAATTGKLAGAKENEEEDELLSCIKDVMSNTNAVSHLLDNTEEDDIHSDSQPDSLSEFEAPPASTHPGRGERVTTRSAAALKAKKGSVTWQDQFACMRAGVQGAGSDGPNSRTIEILQQMLDHNEQVNDQWRKMSYKKAITALKRHPVKIRTAEQARAVVGIGQGISEKIEEIVRTDRLRKLEFVQQDPHFQVLQLFLKIYGVGIKQAQQWIAKGYRTLEDLAAHAKLNAGQQVGLEHFDDLNTRIPRSEVEALGGYVARQAAELDPAVEITIGGSYRRGSATSGDVDLIVTKRGTCSTDDLVPFLHELVERLYGLGFLTATLSSLAAEVQRGHGSKWHGCCVLHPGHGTETSAAASAEEEEEGASRKAIWRRIDFLLVPETELGAAMIYFTGDDIFNRSLRLLADKKGMRLNQRGLYEDVLRGAKRAKITDGKLVEGRNERRIFEILGVKWREPHERWCS